MSKGRIKLSAEMKESTPKDERNAHHSTRKIARRSGVSRSAAQRVLRKDLKVKSVKKVKGQRLGAKIKEKRECRAAEILGMLRSKKSKINPENLFFSYKKIPQFRE